VLSFDVLTGIDDRPVRGYDDLYAALDGRRAGETVVLHFKRGDKEMTGKATLEEVD
jgi:S1-C subfamily serine protease